MLSAAGDRPIENKLIVVSKHHSIVVVGGDIVSERAAVLGHGLEQTCEVGLFVEGDAQTEVVHDSAGIAYRRRRQLISIHFGGF